MAAIGPGGAGNAAGGIDENALFGLACGKFEQADALIRAGHLEATRMVFQIHRRDFQSIGGQFLGLVDGFIGCDLHGGTSGEQRT